MFGASPMTASMRSCSRRLLPDSAFGALAEQRALRQHHRHAAGSGGHRGDHVLDPGVVAVARRAAGRSRAAPRIGLPDLSAPLLEREGRIGDHAVEGGEASGRRIGERGAPERVLADDLEVLDAVEDEVHPGDRRGRQVLLLAVDLAEERSRVAARALHVLDRPEQHAAGAAGRVVDALALLRVEDVDHHPDDAARGVELSCLLALRDVGEPADQVLVGVAEDVGARGRVAERHLGEPFDQVLQDLVGEDLPVAPVGGAEDAVEGVGVRPLDLTHGMGECGTDVGGRCRGRRASGSPSGITKRCISGKSTGSTSPKSSAASAVSSSQTSQMRLKNSSGRMYAFQSVRSTALPRRISAHSQRRDLSSAAFSDTGS